MDGRSPFPAPKTLRLEQVLPVKVPVNMSTATERLHGLLGLCYTVPVDARVPAVSAPTDAADARSYGPRSPPSLPWTLGDTTPRAPPQTKTRTATRTFTERRGGVLGVGKARDPHKVYLDYLDPPNKGLKSVSNHRT